MGYVKQRKLERIGGAKMYYIIEDRGKPFTHKGVKTKKEVKKKIEEIFREVIDNGEIENTDIEIQDEEGNNVTRKEFGDFIGNLVIRYGGA